MSAPSDARRDALSPVAVRPYHSPADAEGTHAVFEVQGGVRRAEHRVECPGEVADGLDPALPGGAPLRQRHRRDAVKSMIY